MKFTLTLLCCGLAALSLHAQTDGAQFFSAWQVHEIRLQFTQTGYFDSLKANYTTDTYLRCAVSIDGSAYSDSGAKYKGNSSYNNNSRKKPFRLDLTEFGVSQSHEGLKKLVLNNAFKDPTLLREKLMLDFLRAQGLAAPRACFARLFINDHYWGVYTVIEDIGKPFLDDHFGNKNGNLFKGDPHGDLRWKGADQSLYYTDYELKTNELENNWSDLVDLLEAINQTPQAQLVDSLEQHLNLDAWFGYWAAHNLFVNLDSYVGSGHNYYLYHNTDTGRFEWITWDVNEAFGNFNMGLNIQALKMLPFTHIPQPFTNRPLMNRLLMLPAMKQRLADEMCLLLESFSSDALNPHIDSLADLIRADVYADTLKFFNNTQFEQNIEQDLTAGGGPMSSGQPGLKPFITARRAALLPQLSAFGCALSGVAESAAAAVRVFPNPASEQIGVEGTFAPNTRVQVWSSNGRLLSDTPLTDPASGHFSLSVTAWPAGVYCLRLLSDHQVAQAQFVKL